MSLNPYLPGAALALSIAAFSMALEAYNPSFDAQVLSLVIGMFAGNRLVRRETFRPGVETTLSGLLPAGLTLYSTQLVVTGMRGSFIAYVLLVCGALFGLTLLLARAFNIDRKTALLLASGLSICGAPAVAVISPMLGVRREETSVSVVSLLMLGLIGMIFYPLIHNLFSLSNGEFNFLAGATIPMLGQVKVAAASVCPECLDEAVRVNLLRLSFFLFPMTAVYFLSDRKQSQPVPWFMVIFMGGVLGANTTGVFRPFLGQLQALSGFCLAAALAAIGYCIDFDEVIDKGIAPLGVLCLAWGVVLLLMYFIRNIF